MSLRENTRSGILASSRKAFLAGAAGLAILGLGFGEMLALPDSTARAQTGIQVTPPASAPASFTSIVKQVSPAVVSVKVQASRRSVQMSSDDSFGMPGLQDLPQDHPMNRWFRRFGENPNFGGNEGRNRRMPHPQMGQGSGFIISADGYVVTNNHVIDKGDKVEITTNDGSSYAARAVGVDEKTDLALLKIEGADKTFPFVKFAETAPEVGDWVVTVGNPFGLGGTVTAGIVSARGRDIGAGSYDDFLQIDAPINKGNSGGPAFNLKGEVIGVNTAIFSPSGGSIGIGFAIPSEVAAKVVNDLREHGQVTRGWLGVQIQPVTRDIAESLGLKEAQGALVSEAQSGGPAARAGIRSGDVVVSVNGEPIKDARELARKIGGLNPDSTARIGVVRNGRDETVEVRLGKLPASDQRLAARGGSLDDQARDVGSLGLTLAPAGSMGRGAGGKGVVVTDVEPDSEAALKGLKAGDVILEVGGQAVERPSDVRNGVQAAEGEGRKAVLFRVQSGEQTRFVALNLKKSG